MSEPNQQPASEQPPGDKTVPVPPSNLPPYQAQGQPPAGGYQQPQYQQSYPQQQPQYQQNYPPQYQQNYPPQYQQSNQPHYQTYTSGVNATSGLLGRLSLGRKIVMFAGIIALLAFLLPWYVFSPGSIDQEAIAEMSQSEQNALSEELIDLFGASTLRGLQDPDDSASASGLHGGLALVAFLAVLVLTGIAALPLSGRRLRDSGPKLPEGLLIAMLALLALLGGLVSMLAWNSAVVSIGLGFYLALLALLASLGGAVMMFGAGE